MSSNIVHFDGTNWADGAPAATEQTSAPGGLSVTIGSHTHRWNASGESSSSGPTRWQPEAPDPSRTGVAATLSTLYGKDGGGRVTLPDGNVTYADNAVRMGLCRWDGDRLVDVGMPTEQAVQLTREPEKAPAADPGIGVYTPADDTAMQEVAEPFSQAAWDSTQARVLATMQAGSNDFSNAALEMARMESAAGRPMTPEQALPVIEKMVGYHLAAGGRAVRPILGNDQARLDAFMDFLQADPSRMGAAFSALVYERNPARLVEAAERFALTTPTKEAEQLRRAGLAVRYATNGEMLVRRLDADGGRWVSIHDLAKATA